MVFRLPIELSLLSVGMKPPYISTSFTDFCNWLFFSFVIHAVA